MVTPAPPTQRPAHAGETGVVLVAGFDPFGGGPTSAAMRVATALHRRQVTHHRIVGAELPPSCAAALERLEQLLQRHPAALVIGLGLTSGRAALQLDRVAVRRGGEPSNLTMVGQPPSAYLSTLPIEAMQRAMTAAGVPTETSQNASCAACNELFFALMHRLASRPEANGTRGGFIYLPPLPGQGRPSMPLNQLVHGVRTGIRIALGIPAPPATA